MGEVVDAVWAAYYAQQRYERRISVQLEIPGLNQTDLLPPCSVGDGCSDETERQRKEVTSYGTEARSFDHS